MGKTADQESGSIGRPAAGAVRTLHARGVALADPREQRRVLDEASLRGVSSESPVFASRLADHGWPELRPGELEILQINLGHLCNMSCRHCHVDAGPDRHDRVMSKETIDDCLQTLDRTTAHTVDLTGGAPEMNPHFRYLVEKAAGRGKHLIDRCNLTILLEPAYRDLPHWLGERGVEMVCSLPHFRQRNTDAQRGPGSFARSVEALRALNRVGYGQGDPQKQLTLMANPAGAFLAGDQSQMEDEWKATLLREHGVSFDRLIALNNMPCARFLEWLVDSGNLGTYLTRLVTAFNPETIAGLMCRNTLSVSWDGRVFDCDFNQMLDLPLHLPGGSPPHIKDLDLGALAQRRIVTGPHCFGCTAGSGSSCAGATAS